MGAAALVFWELEQELGLENRLTSKVGLLSGGQRQAITLLMASLKRPKVLLLDEHTAALDPKTAAKVLALSDKIVAENKLTTLMITHNMKDAMNRKCMCMLRNYSSPHSKTVSDRIVEPFLFMNNGLDIRCHEIKSHTNKTFKLARIGEVELLDVEWIAEKEHKQVFTDLFMFSGEERHAVTLLLDQLARNLIVEEYPASATCISPVDDDPRHWLFTTDVASYLGIGRFVMGLFNHIKVMGDDNSMLYIRNEVESMKM